MRRYRAVKTTLGHRYYMRMTEDERSERAIFRIAVVAMPFLGSILLTAVWLWRG